MGRSRGASPQRGSHNNRLALLKVSLEGVNKNGVSTFLRSIGHFFFVRSNCWGPVTSENKCVWPQNLALCEVLGSKCDKNKCGKTSGKFVKLVSARLPFVAETSKQC